MKSPSVYASMSKKDVETMAEYDKGRLYWIKLTDRFIASDTVDFLMSQKNGSSYVVLYQMLCLKTVNNGGVLARELGEMIVPYDIEKIQRDCKWFSIDTVRVALELYKRLGLVYEMNNGILAINDFDRLIGSQTYGAEKKALQRQSKENSLLQSGQKVDICPPDKEIYKEKYKDIELNNNSTPTATKKHKYGEHKNVLLTEEEHTKLQERFPDDYQKKIDTFSEAIARKGYKYKSHYLAILDWDRRDQKKAPQQTASSNPFLDMLKG